MKNSCPLPLQYEHIVIAHGGGGRLMQQLLAQIVQPTFDNTYLRQQHDSARLNFDGQALAFTTDSYVIKPLFFNGGDIGKLAVCGTVNDLAMSGAKPLFLTCSLIIEEGLAIEDLKKILQSMQQTAEQAGVQIVTGDTKVVEKGKGDGLYINTAGIGVCHKALTIAPSQIKQGDAILVSGDLARHGIAIMLEREGLEFESDIQSDCALLSPLVEDLINAGIALHCLRDLTRGGLASVLIELAASCNKNFKIQESQIPVAENTLSACEILGFDPLYIANEGCFALFLPQSEVEPTLAILHKHKAGQNACQIGTVMASSKTGHLSMETVLGVERRLDLLSGEQLPRIC